MPKLYTDLLPGSTGAVNLGSSSLEFLNIYSQNVLVDDEVYGVAWDGSLEVPTKNAVYDAIEGLALGDLWSDPVDSDITFDTNEAYNIGTSSFKPNIIYADTHSGKFEATDGSNTSQMGITAEGQTVGGALFSMEPPGTPSDALNWDGTNWRIGTNNIAVASDIPTGGTDFVSKTAGGTFDADISVPDEAYNATTWDGSLEVPTKNAIRDELENLNLDFVTLDTSQTITAGKTFSLSTTFNQTIVSDTRIVSNADTNAFSLGASGSAVFSNASGQFSIKEFGQTTAESLAFDLASITAHRTYTWPDANGTVALTSDIPTGGTDYVSKTAGGTFDADISVPNEVYSASWSGVNEVPTKAALYAKIETIPAVNFGVNGAIPYVSGSNFSYDGGLQWNNSTGNLEVNGLVVSDITPSFTNLLVDGDTSDNLVAIDPTTGVLKEITQGTIEITESQISDLDSYLPLTGGIMTGAIEVPDEVYGAGWNGNLEVPTKNAVYDQIESLALGATTLGGLTDVTITAAATGEYLRYNGSAWVDSTIQASDIPTLTDYVAVTGDNMTGDLSIGATTNVGHKVQVFSDTAAWGSQGGVQFTNAANQSSYIWMDDSNSLNIQNGSSANRAIDFNEGKVLITGSGDLQISRDATCVVEIIGLDGTGGIVGTDTNHNLILRRNNIEALTIQASNIIVPSTHDFTVQSGVLDLGVSGTQNAEFRARKSDSAGITYQWEDNYWRARRGGSGTVAGWAWDNFDTRVFKMDLGGMFTLDTVMTMQNSPDRAGLLEIGSTTTTYAWYGIQVKDASGQLWSFMGDDNEVGIYDDTNSEWALKYTENNSLRLYYNGSTKLTTTSTGITVTGDGVATDWNLSSDERLKENIKPLGDYKIHTNWVQYDWKESGKHDIGLIAQELEKTNPEFVKEDDEGMKSVSYTKVLVAKMAEKDRQIEDLEARLERLENLLKDRL